MKAILVIDEMPSNCMECKYCGWSARDEEKRACMLLEGWFFNDEDIEESRSVICPLKPMPQRQNKDEKKSSLEYIYEADTLDEFQSRGASYLYGHIDGWNDCLKEIEEEEWKQY